MTATDDDIGTDDRGLQVERTELAWVRTALTGGGLSLAAAHLADSGTGRALALAAGVLVTAVGVAAAGWRIRSLRSAPHPTAAPRPAPMLLAGALVVADVLVLALLAT